MDYGNIRFEMGYASAIATLLFAVMLITQQAVQRMLRKIG
jgi:multiple sugar transport system permease protein